MRKLFLIFSLYGLLGCAEEKPQMPAGLLPPAQLTSILADIHIAEAQIDQLRVNPDTSRAIFEKLEAEIFQKHGVSSAAFDSTYNYYLNNLSALDNIYEGLVDTLSLREVKFTSQAGPAVANQDSLQPKAMPDTLKKDLIQKIRAKKDLAKKDSAKK